MINISWKMTYIISKLAVKSLIYMLFYNTLLKMNKILFKLTSVTHLIESHHSFGWILKLVLSPLLTIAVY